MGGVEQSTLWALVCFGWVGLLMCSLGGFASSSPWSVVVVMARNLVEGIPREVPRWISAKCLIKEQMAK